VRVSGARESLLKCLYTGKARGPFCARSVGISGGTHFGPAPQMLQYNVGQCADMVGTVVQCRNVVETFTTRGKEYLAILFIDLFQGFKTICAEARADDLRGKTTFSRPFFQCMVGVSAIPHAQNGSES
jgi:hypothetical protein